MGEKREFAWIRSALFVPGDRLDRIDKAVATAADAVIIDLEDAVAPSHKIQARAIAGKKVAGGKDKKILVRVNALNTEFAADDFSEVIAAGLDGIMVPKVETPGDIRQIDAIVLETEKKRGLEPGSVFILPLIESARGVENAFAIASEKTESQRGFTLSFGAADFALDMGINITRSGQELIYPRARLAVACRAAGLAPPIDTPFMIDLKDRKALEADILRAVRLGFQGKLCIHPNQVEICNQLFSPTAEEIAQARKVIETFDRAQAEGVAAIQLNGKFLDPPVVERARRILKLAEAKLQPHKV
jgi:citrate lyase subunit beta/citryl-CoA lyase